MEIARGRMPKTVSGYVTRAPMASLVLLLRTTYACMSFTRHQVLQPQEREMSLALREVCSNLQSGLFNQTESQKIRRQIFAAHVVVGRVYVRPRLTRRVGAASPCSSPISYANTSREIFARDMTGASPPPCRSNHDLEEDFVVCLRVERERRR